MHTAEMKEHVHWEGRDLRVLIADFQASSTFLSGRGILSFFSLEQMRHGSVVYDANFSARLSF